MEVVELVRAGGGEVVGVASVVDRRGGKALFDVPFRSAMKIDIDTYEPEECPLCKAGSVAVKPGSRNLK